MGLNYFTAMNYSIDPILDRKLADCIASGVKSITSNTYELKISFSNGVDAEFWNANKWYAWLHSGRIGSYVYSCGRPRKKTMRALCRLIADYYINNK